MTTTDARNALKSRLDIATSITTFDSYIDAFVLDGVSRLSPTVYEEVDEQEVSVTPNSRGQVTIDLSALASPIDDVREVQARDGDDEWPIDDFRVHGRKLRVRGLDDNISVVAISGLKEYSLSTVPSYLQLPVYYFAMAEFYTFLMANKAKYNVYMQNGRAAVDNMQDLIDFWENKGLQYLADKGFPYGR